MTDLLGNRALVTGASRGIGAAIAVTLAKAGADVAITYSGSKEKADAVVKSIQAAGRKGLAIKADSANDKDVQRSVDETVSALGGLDILVNNAGIARDGAIEDMRLEDIDALLAVNVRGVVLASRAAIPHLGKGGRIISIGSNLAESVALPGLTVYSMTKSALVSFTKGLARDLGPRGITVNLVNPGSTNTDMNPADGENAASQLAFSALGHFGTPDDIAEMVAFLAGPKAKQITGAGFLVDGGFNA
jgi:3-oxoacyl-[acyl-carrier protein] reductase